METLVNRLVLRFGGKEGWFGYFYTETVQEEAERRLSDLRRQRMRVEFELEDQQSEMRRLERRTKRLWNENHVTEARQSARDLRASRVAFTRAGAQKMQIDSVSAMMQELVSGEAVENHIAFYALAMGERLQVSNPQRMARILQRCSTLDEMRKMTAEQLKEHFDDAEQDELDRVSDEQTDETLTEDVLVELGCLARIEDAMTPPTTVPPKKGGGGGGGGGGRNDRRRLLNVNNNVDI